jgi:hypothetical protein
VTQLGDASIKITLDPQAAKAEADRFKRQMDELDRQRKKLQEEMERAQRGEASLIQQHADPNAPMGRRAGPGANNAPGRWEDQGAVPDTSSKSAQSIQNTVKDYLSKANLASSLVQKSTVITEAVKDVFNGTIFEGLAKSLDTGVKSAAEKAINVGAHLSSVPDTITDTVDYNMAALKLGGRFPMDQDAIIRDFYEINLQQTNLRKNIDLETQRVTMRTIIDATKLMFNR